mmetsp:Transcript_86049/g.200077  ORF Transcript_86049/g.200077 Transcript_86049/m.200077 type:complete len:322 (+) Transcript_86049:42-1007(+)
MGQQCSAGTFQDSEPHSITVDSIKNLRIAPHVHLSQERCKLSESYEISDTVLGKGLGGEVVLVRGKGSDKSFAMKTVKKKQRGDVANKASLTNEVEIFMALDHPHIVQLHSIYETGSHLFLLMECCSGGELYARLQQRGAFPDADAIEATQQMLKAVSYLHGRRIVHRDLKLENFLYQSDEPTAHLKLIDFGFAHVWDGVTLMKAPCGSLSYVSPDVLFGDGYTDKCDLWSLGVIVWMLLSGYPPFHGEEQVIMTKIKAGQPDWSHQKRWKPVTTEAIDFVRKLLVKEPKRRMDASAAARHPWLAPGSPSRTFRRQCIAGG